MRSKKLTYIYYKKSDEIFHYIYIIFFSLIICSSVVFSWYILWLIPLLPFMKYKWPVIILSFTIIFQYLLIYFDNTEHHTFKYLENGEILSSQLIIWLPLLITFFIQFYWPNNEQYKR